MIIRTTLTDDVTTAVICTCSFGGHLSTANSLNISISDTQVTQVINIRSNSQFQVTLSKSIGDSEANLFDTQVLEFQVLFSYDKSHARRLEVPGKSES